MDGFRIELLKMLLNQVFEFLIFILNDLGYQGFLDSINRVEKDGPDARLDPAPFFGKPWEISIREIEGGYSKLLESIQAKGFGLGGLIYDAQNTAWSLSNRDHFHLDGYNPDNDVMVEANSPILVR